MVEASPPCSKDIMLFNSFGSHAIEPVVSDMPLPSLNAISPCNSTEACQTFSLASKSRRSRKRFRLTDKSDNDT
jgi:hypothetical protein